jgi:hypothetical protein
MTKKRRVPRGRGRVTSGGAFKKGQAKFSVHPRGPQTDTVYPGTVFSQQELAEQYQIMLALKVEAQKQLRLAQQTARRLEKRENLLKLAEQVDGAAGTLEDAVGRLQRTLHILVDFAQKPPVRLPAGDME